MNSIPTFAMQNRSERIIAMERANELIYQTSLFVYECEKDAAAKRKAELQRVREQLEHLAQLRQAHRSDSSMEA